MSEAYQLALIGSMASLLAAIIAWIGHRLERHLERQDAVFITHGKRLRRIERRLRDVRRKVGLWREGDDKDDDDTTVLFEA